MARTNVVAGRQKEVASGGMRGTRAGRGVRRGERSLAVAEGNVCGSGSGGPAVKGEEDVMCTTALPVSQAWRRLYEGWAPNLGFLSCLLQSDGKLCSVGSLLVSCCGSWVGLCFVSFRGTAADSTTRLGVGWAWTCFSDLMRLVIFWFKIVRR